jgi:hypothetical protein
VPLYRNSESINLLDPEGPFKVCTWIAFTRSKTFFNKLIVAYPPNPFSSCNVKRKVNCFGHRLVPTDPAVESMNRVHTPTHYSFSVPYFRLFFSFIYSQVSYVPSSLSLFCLGFCTFLFSLSRIVVLVNHFFFVLVTQIMLRESKYREPPLDVITCVFVVPHPLLIQMCRSSTACSRKPGSLSSFIRHV